MTTHQKILIEPTTRCTRDCWFCRPGAYPPEDMTSEHHERVLGYMASIGWDRALHYSGFGEPTIHPQFVEFTERAHAMCPDAQLSLFTNGDGLTVDGLHRLAKTLDWIAWDIYELDETVARMGRYVQDSGFPPERFRVVNQVSNPAKKISRAGALWQSNELSESSERSCTYLGEQLNMTADGNWVMCCNDMRRRQTWPGTLSISELVEQLDYRGIHAAISKRRGDFFVCRECEQPSTGNPWHGKGPARFCPTIDKTDFWPG